MHARILTHLHPSPPTPPTYAHAKQVSNMALRLVASMQRDWIQAGRRPSGICGAALFLAAIYHDKPRTYKDVGRIVRVSPETIKKRVDGAWAETRFAGLLGVL